MLLSLPLDFCPKSGSWTISDQSQCDKVTSTLALTIGQSSPYRHFASVSVSMCDCDCVSECALDIKGSSAVAETVAVHLLTWTSVD